MEILNFVFLTDYFGFNENNRSEVYKTEYSRLVYYYPFMTG